MLFDRVADLRFENGLTVRADRTTLVDLNTVGESDEAAAEVNFLYFVSIVLRASCFFGEGISRLDGNDFLFDSSLAH